MAHLYQPADAVLSLSAGDRVEVQKILLAWNRWPQYTDFYQSTAKKSAFHDALKFPITQKSSLIQDFFDRP